MLDETPTMMRTPLLVTRLLEHGVRRAANEEVVTVSDTGVHRQTYSELRARACRLAHALHALGVRPGDRVGSLMWNGHHHLEAFYAVPAMGAVLHTLNLRLGLTDLEYTINHAEDRILLVDEDLLEIVVPALSRTPIRHVIVNPGADEWRRILPSALEWDELIASQPRDYPWPEIDEESPMGICYTSGTTGNPKGVVYTHRSTYLHTMAQAMTDAFGLSGTDCIQQVVPMFHVLGWGYPYCATMLGAKQVHMHGPFRAEAMLDTIDLEKVTFSAGVPTVWQSARAAIEAAPERWSLHSLTRINCGAASPDPTLLRWYWDRLNVEIIQTWGMTESNPFGVTSRKQAKRAYVDLPLDDQFRNVAKTGLPLPGIELEIVDDAGNKLPHDGVTPGNLLMRGPWVCAQYYRDPQPDKFRGGWLHTGDIAKIDAESYLIIADRKKDMIKSGGEWISSLDLENHIASIPGVAQAAVVAQPHPRWDERPVALVVLRPGEVVQAHDVIEHCAQRFAKWQLPDDVLFVDKLPLNSTGKYDKRAIRDMLTRDRYRLPSLRSNA